MKNFKSFFLVLAVSVLAFVSCSKDEDKPAGPTYKQPAIASRTEIVAIPDGLQAQADGGDFNASMAVLYMGLANAFGSFTADFTVPEGAEKQNLKNGSSVYYWTYGGYSYWMTYTETALKNTWKYDYQFPEVPRFTFISAEETTNGKSGNWAINNPEAGSHEALWDYVWTLNGDNDFNADLTLYDVEEGNTVFKVLARVNNSGSFQLFDAGVKTVEVIWNTNGSGSWWIFDGTDTYTGTWTAK
jgi:hypothetical protein